MEAHFSSKGLLSNDLKWNDELNITLSESLHIVDAQELSQVDDNSILDKGIRYRDLTVDVMKSDPRTLNKSATFPCREKIFPHRDDSAADEGYGEILEDNVNQLLEINPAPTRSISLPSSLTLVPALKGGRKNMGIPSPKMTVKWAPDVYDPTPTIVSHTVKPKKQQRQWSCKSEKGNKKKKGKKKEKGNKASSRGSSSSKVKKQNPDQCNNGSLYARERLADTSDGFDVCSTDSSCGGSFLRQSSVTNVHMSVAEAL